uniref:Uncharacterized protein n=1 Tax=Kalanchoe fedtschenkoi TaxID=63787 RepID=A0A7N0U8S1_KALFE
MASPLSFLSMSLALFSLTILLLPAVHGIGVNYGLLGSNLPDPNATLSLLESRNIRKIRIFDPNSSVLDALRGRNTSVFIGVKNEDLQALATDPASAAAWVSAHVQPYAASVSIAGVVAGNEVIPGPLAQYVERAMGSLDEALKAANVTAPVSTAVSYAVMGSSYPPSAGSFSDDASEVMQGVARFLAARKYPLLANIYPYFAYISDPDNISPEYTFFTSTVPVVVDGELNYFNLLDSMVDALYSALERVEATSVEVVVSETGWPSAGDKYATLENAKLYNQNLVKHVESGDGTPKRAGKKLEAYIFAAFNENQKPAGTEQNFGLYYPNLTEVYHVDFP